MEKLDEYASLRLNEDYNNPTAQILQENSNLLRANFEETCSFIDSEILAIDDAAVDRYLADPILTDWTTPLQRLRRMRPYLLSKSQEDEYFAALGKQQVRGSEEKIYQLTSHTMNFGTVKDAKGHLAPLTQSNFPSFLREANREVRKEAFGKFYDTFFKYGDAIASTLTNAIQEHVILARAKHYPSSREAALFPDNIPTSVYDKLITTVHSRLPALHRYYELRRRAYDLNAPLVPAAEKKYTFEEAITTVMAALQPLGEEYVTTLEKGLRQERWCDRYENQGKRTGAFTSHASYQNHPYISMNFDGSLNTVYTLAHENNRTFSMNEKKS